VKDRGDAVVCRDRDYAGGDATVAVGATVAGRWRSAARRRLQVQESSHVAYRLGGVGRDEIPIGGHGGSRTVMMMLMGHIPIAEVCRWM
jgi:hypothetical protein